MNITAIQDGKDLLIVEIKTGQVIHRLDDTPLPEDRSIFIHHRMLEGVASSPLAKAQVHAYIPIFELRPIEPTEEAKHFYLLRREDAE